MKRLRFPIDRPADGQLTEVLRKIVLVVPSRRLMQLARAGGDRVTRFFLRCMGPVLALKRPSTPTPEGLLTEVLRTKNARAGFVSP
jgi:hypothetical protein